MIILLLQGITAIGQVRTIDFYISQGILNSPLLKELSSQIRSNSLDSLITDANRQPRISLNGTLSYAPVINDFGYSKDVTNGGLFSSLLNVSQDILNKRTIEAQYRKLGLQNQALANSGKLTEKELRKDITLQYLNAYFVFAETRLSYDILSLMKEEDTILRQLTEKGIFRQTDYLAFYLARQSQELQYRDGLTQYSREFGRLNLISGVLDTSEVTLSLPVFENVNAGNPLTSPFFQRFRIDSLSIQNEKTLIDRNYKPKITWYSDAGIINNVPADLYKNLGISLGMSLSLPVYDGNQRRLNYMKLKNSEELRKNWQDYFTQRYSQELRQLKTELSRTQSMIPDAEKQIAVAELLLKADKNLLETGNLPVTDYVLVLKSYIGYKNNLHQYRKRVLEIITELNYWEQQ